MRLPTDRNLLEEIYCRYYKEFVQFGERNSTRQTKVMVPIDIRAIAQHFGVDEDIVFGRLYYHLEWKYGYKRDDSSKVAFFTLGGENERHCVNFALLSSVLAGLQEERRKDLWAIGLSIAALSISILSIVLTVAT